MKNNFKGGMSSDLTAFDVAKKWKISPIEFMPILEKGTEHEMEHTDDKDIARRIALDHIVERLDYYDLLDKIEKMKIGGVVKKSIQIAPNGRPSHLTQEQWQLVRTPDFKGWFGFWDLYAYDKANEYYEPSVRKIAKELKENKLSAIEEVANFLSRQVTEDDVLIPMPSRTGISTDTKKLAEKISEKTGAKIFDCLVGRKRESIYQLKKRNEDVSDFDFEFQINCEIPKAKNYFIVDNVIATGVTMKNALKNVMDKVGDNVSPLVYAIDLNYISKVVDENGEPLVVYHGTKYIQEFYDFDLDAIEDEKVKAFFFSKGYEHAERYTWNRGSVKAFFLKAIKLFDPKLLSTSESKKIRSILNESVVEDFIEYNYLDGLEEWKSKYDSNMSDEDLLFYILTQTDSSWQVVELKGVQDYLKSNDYNGFITYEQVTNQSTPNINYAVFEPNQIKLADGTNTTFDGNNPDIRFDNGGDVETFYTRTWADGTIEKFSVEDYEKNILPHLENPDFRFEKGGDVNSEIEKIAKSVVFDLGEQYSENDYLGKCKEISEEIAKRLNQIDIKAIPMRIIDGEDKKYNSPVFNHAYTFIPMTNQIIDTQLWQVDGNPTDLNSRKVLFDFDDYNNLVELYEVEPIFDWENKFAKGGLIAPNTTFEKGGRFDDQKLLKEYNANKSIGFSAIAHLKSKGLIPRADGTKRKSEKYMEDGGINLSNKELMAHDFFNEQKELQRNSKYAILLDASWSNYTNEQREVFNNLKDELIDKLGFNPLINYSPFGSGVLNNRGNVILMFDDDSNLLGLLEFTIEPKYTIVPRYSPDYIKPEPIFENNENVFYLEYIFSFSRGNGQKMMNRIKKYAEQYNVDIGLEGSIIEGTEGKPIASAKHLKRFYDKQGFINVMGHYFLYIPNIMAKGGKTISQTPAPASDRVSGSKTNPKGSASDTSLAKSIKFNDSLLKAIENKVKAHNEEYPSKKVTTPTAKAVVRRGMGAYSKSHRPFITGGAPNSRQAWGLARLNKFLLKKRGVKVKSAYIQDDDLL